MTAKLALVLLVGCAAEPAPVPSTLFVSDYRANAIFRYDGVTGEFRDTFASGYEQRVDRPAGLRRSGDLMYAAGFGHGEVVRYDLRSGAMHDIFFWDTTSLEEPVELVFHGDELVVLGNDTNNFVVLDPNGTAMRSFGYPEIRRAHDFVIDGAGRALVATEPAIQVWDVATGTRLPDFGHFAMAMSIAIADDTIFVADWELGQVVAGERVLIDGLEHPVSIDIGPDGALYVLDDTGIQRFDRETGERLSRLLAKDDRLLMPRAFVFVPD